MSPAVIDLDLARFESEEQRAGGIESDGLAVLARRAAVVKLTRWPRVRLLAAHASRASAKGFSSRVLEGVQAGRRADRRGDAGGR